MTITTRSTVFLRAVCGLPVVWALAGCGSKVTKSNFDQITNGMTLAQVEGILGKGAESTGVAGSAKVVTWTDANKTITITFANDKVVLKASNGL